MEIVYVDGPNGARMSRKKTGRKLGAIDPNPRYSGALSALEKKTVDQRSPLQKERFQLFNSPLEQSQRALDRARCGHVYAGRLQGLQRKLRSAGVQKPQIFFNCARLIRENTFRQRYGS